ncbi:MAG: hypothetical protein HZA89_17255 [Verrucomicrobia bacterium]|nr:hypothetical protein [Verrucomicrobiota bacterium]
MKTSSRLNRRAFLARSAQVTAAVSLVGTPLLAAKTKTTSFTVAAAQVRGLAVSHDGLVAVAADNAIVFHRLDGSVARRVATAKPVRAVSFDARGRLFATFKNQVARLDDAGELVPLGAPLGRQSALTGLAIADDGIIFAADSGERVVWRLDAGGKVLGKIQPGENGFAVPRAFFPIAWRDGKLFVANPGRHQIHTYSAEGKLLAKWGAHTRDLDGFSGCCNPVGFAALADGTVVTAERGQPRVKVFDGAGKYHRLLAGPEEFAASIAAARADSEELAGCQAGLLDVAATSDGRVVILDRTTREVRVLA